MLKKPGNKIGRMFTPCISFGIFPGSEQMITLPFKSAFESFCRMNQPCFSYLFLHIVYLPGQMTSVIAGLSPSHFEPTQCHSTGDGATPSSESLVILVIEEWESLTFR